MPHNFQEFFTGFALTVKLYKNSQTNTHEFPS